MNWCQFYTNCMLRSSLTELIRSIPRSIPKLVLSNNIVANAQLCIRQLMHCFVLCGTIFSTTDGAIVQLLQSVVSMRVH